MISYFKKSVSNVYKVSKQAVTKVVKKEGNYPYKGQAILAELRSCKKTMLPTKKMNQLASLSYQMEQFEAITLSLFQILTTNDHFHLTYLYEPPVLNRKMRYVKNYLIVCIYLIKHGASGFIDEFRDRMEVFEHYSQQKIVAANTPLAFQLKERAGHVISLLTDKTRLLKQKQLAMLVKQKLKLSLQSDNINCENQSQLANIENGENEQRELSKGQKLQNFLDAYLFRYVTKVDEQLDRVAQFLARQAQKYLLQQMPQNFEIEQLEQDYKLRSQANLQQIHRKEQSFIRQKNKKKVQNKDLLELE